ncbi:predicted protein, partial [Nematostella vectensis]
CAPEPCQNGGKCRTSDLAYDTAYAECICPACFHSPGPLGMQDGRILDSQLSASSKYDNAHGANFGRLHNPFVPSLGNYGCWAAKNKQARAGEFLHINLLVPTYITKVATQGKNDPYSQQWVKRYRLDYSPDGTTWAAYKVRLLTIFTGNSDVNSVMANAIDDPFKAKAVRFVVQEWNGHISLRVELYGCPTQ